MCGIVGIITRGEQAAPLVLQGLKALEYRGYDSAGIATITSTGEIDRLRAEGKLKNLEAMLSKKPLSGEYGIGHTRWATHGAATVTNAHPHSDHGIAVVHNGIIENFRELRAECEKAGEIFHTETDTEVVLKLLVMFTKQGLSPHDAMKLMLEKLHGAFALAILFSAPEARLFVARKGSPLAIGYGDYVTACASDAYALAHCASRITYLEEGDWAECRAGEVQIFDKHNQKVERAIQPIQVSGAMMGKGNFRHYMQKEIFEQPVVLGDTLSAYINPAKGSVELPKMPFDLANCSRISIIACGTSYYAGMVAKYWCEKLARVGVEVSVASEFRYGDPVFAEKGLVLGISQSGETADTLAALHYAKTHHQHVLVIVNAESSSMMRAADCTLRTLAGPEIGVASTKAFTTQLATLACFVLALAKARGAIKGEELRRLTHALMELPSRAAEVLTLDVSIQKLARSIAKARDVLYIGRGANYPIALEGALKLKEISYIHAEGIAAGELKHGPIALIDKKVPVIVIAPPDALFEKVASNVQEVAARGGRVILVSTREKIAALSDVIVDSITMPEVDSWVAPILYSIPVQLLAYHVAVFKGTDVDQPRNLAKSVTVE